MKELNTTPPRIFLNFFRWYCHRSMRNYIEGDLMEVYASRLRASGKRHADLKFIIDVILLFRPGIIRPIEENRSLNTYGMYKSYFKVGWRNLLRTKGYSFINIGGLALGMCAAMLIGLWIWDEVSADKNIEQSDRIAAVLQNQTFDGRVSTSSTQSYQLGVELRNNYSNYFKRVVISSFTENPILSYEDNVFTKTGYFMEGEGPEMLSLNMLSGSREISNPNSILLSETTAKTFFGNADPVGKTLKIDNQFDVSVTGVYEDMPPNSSFNDMLFVAPLDILTSRNGNLGWGNNWLEVYVQLSDNVDMQKASEAIRDAKLSNVDLYQAKLKPELLLHPLPRWRLYSRFDNGVNTGGRIDFVILIGIIGAFVLMLACINFMNLSTARSARRAREVGVRKVVGSGRGQLIGQFLSESFLIVSLAFVLAVLLVNLTLPWFNDIAGKRVIIEWVNPWFWLFSMAVVFVTALVAGSYPAFYLSGFRASKVLKGTFRASRFSSVPRKVLVVLQFTVSVILIIGTVVVYQQIQFAKNRELGYQNNGLLTVPMKSDGVRANYTLFREDLLGTGMFEEVSRSESMVTNMYNSNGDSRWKGKDPGMQDNIYRGAVDFGFGKTVGWRIKEGRDFSREFATDSSAMILNEAAVKYMGFEDPIGEIVRLYNGHDYTIIGVVEDMVTQSLYEPAKQTYYIVDPINRFGYIDIRISPSASVGEALGAIGRVFKKYNPTAPFEYSFADDQVAGKFEGEARFGKLAGIFAVLAIIISCLGISGLASYVAEQRTKEIGIRKVVGASVFSLWKMLSKDFVLLVIIACVIALPAAYLAMEVWLEQFAYRTPLSWVIFGVTFLTVLVITISTVSVQAINAARMNPVKSLKSE